MHDTAKVIINLGAPSKPTPECAEKFLLEFLSDARVLSLPQPFRYFLAKIISKKRKFAYAKALANIFQDGVHPLKKHTQSLAEKASLPSREVYVAYRYGENNIAQVVKRLKQNGTRRFLFLPLYPHYARATTRTVEKAVRKVLKKREFKIAKPYFNDHDFISALASTVPTKCKTLVVSFHSIPLNHLKKTPNYKAHCEITAQMLGKLLGINDIHIAWQSKMGKDEWIEPQICDVLRNLAKSGRKDVTVISPSFACDCSETLNEIGVDAKKAFLEAGGEHFYLCRCLNDSPAHVKLVSKIFKNLETTL